MVDLIDFIQIFSNWSYNKEQDRENFNKESQKLKYVNGVFYYDDGTVSFLIDEVTNLDFDVHYLSINEEVNTIHFLNERRDTLNIKMLYQGQYQDLDYSITPNGEYNYLGDIYDGETITYSMPPYTKTTNEMVYYCSGWSVTVKW